MGWHQQQLSWEIEHTSAFGSFQGPYQGFKYLLYLRVGKHFTKCSFQAALSLFLGYSARVLKGLTVVAGELSVVGRALVLHEKPDDLRTQPSGNSGARIGCGVIVAK